MPGLAIDAVEQRGDEFRALTSEVPSNRGDCLSHIAVAREIATIEKTQISAPLILRNKNPEGKRTSFASDRDSRSGPVSRYAGRVVRA
jgi:phenylalanyl-tRNA synthetase beta subunit